MVILCALFVLIFLSGALKYIFGLENNDETSVFNGKALWIFGGAGLIACIFWATIM